MTTPEAIDPTAATRRVLHLSALHISQQDFGKRLDDHGDVVFRRAAARGGTVCYLVWVPADARRDDRAYGRRMEMPYALTKILPLGRDLGCDAVLIDPLAPVVEGIRTYVWRNNLGTVLTTANMLAEREPRFQIRGPHLYGNMNGRRRYTVVDTAARDELVEYHRNRDDAIEAALVFNHHDGGQEA